jgi:hypothetical protein
MRRYAHASGLTTTTHVKCMTALTLLVTTITAATQPTSLTQLRSHLHAQEFPMVEPESEPETDEEPMTEGGVL